MRKINSISTILMIVLCLSINMFGKFLAETFMLPVWLDSIGTVLMAYALGPVCGAIVGVTGNILYSLFFGTSIIYGLASIAIGIVVGICAKKGYMNSVFGILSTAFLVTIFAVTVSTPISLIQSGGEIGNIWGESVRRFLNEMGFPPVISCIIGQTYVDFLDKVISVLIVSVAIRVVRKLRANHEKIKEKKAAEKVSGVLLALILTSAVILPQIPAKAESINEEKPDEHNFSTFFQTVYNNENGFTVGMATDILQTKNGVIWIGTYNGLYRYTGNAFQWMNEFESVKTVNCLFTDEAGRLWIGTNDNGISICINQKIVNVVNSDNGLSSDSVRCIAENSNGDYFVGTSGSLSVMRFANGLDVCKTINEIVYAISISADKNGNTAAVTDEGKLFLLAGMDISDSRLAEYDRSSYTCCAFDKSGLLYAGTSSDKIDVFKIENNKLNKISTIVCEGLETIKSINFVDKTRTFICADNGIGFLDENLNYNQIRTDNFNQSIEHMLEDYQGNLWFSSTRLGLLRLCTSMFTDIYRENGIEENVVNAVTEWQGSIYVGTDGGLDIADRNNISETAKALTERLKGVRIRCLYVNSENSLWICTSGRGIFEVSESGEIKVYDSQSGTVGDKFRTIIERKDGSMVAAGDSGITFIENDVVMSGLSAADGLTNAKVLSLYEAENGDIYAGTDGNGIAVIRGGKLVKELKKEDGLSSEVILRMVADKDYGGLFIITGNGLCYMESNGRIRFLDNFPYYNNFDIMELYGGKLFVTGSAGIYVVEKFPLLSGRNLQYEILNVRKGLRLSLTPNSWNYVDNDGNPYFACSSGVVRMNMALYNVSARSYHMLLDMVKVDGKSMQVDKGEAIIIPREASLIEFTPEVVNYSINDPNICVFLEGYDKTPKIMALSEMENVIYSNLPSGEYVLRIAVLQGNTDDILAEVTYNVVKEREFYDNVWFMVYMIVVGAIFVTYITWMLFRTQIQKTLRLQRLQIEQSKKQIEMGNETIITIAKAVDAKDENTSQHSSRVSEYSVLIAKELGFDEEQCEKLRQTALLHDIGKIGIPDSILNKPSKLTDEEYAIMKTHVTRGAEILKNFTLIDNVSEGALYHHERYDGSGYVSGLKGDEIPLNARIIGIADAFDAMTANRVYRKQLDIDFVIEELKKCSGKQFDPNLVNILLKLIENGTIDIESLYNTSMAKKEERNQ